MRELTLLILAHTFASLLLTTPLSAQGSKDRPRNGQSPVVNSYQIYEAHEIDSATVTCQFDYIVTTAFRQGVIQHGKSEKQKRPIIITFMNLASDAPTLKAVGAGESGSEAKLLKLPHEDAIILVQAETGAIGDNFSVYRIHLNNGIVTWTKNYRITDIPVVSSSMGFCR